MSQNNQLAPKRHRTEYIVIFFVLAFLTALELAIPGLKAEYKLKAIGLISLALGKAFVVAYFYMHLKEERGWLKFIAAIPITAGLYAIVLILESIYR